LLTFANGIGERIEELQAQAAERAQSLQTNASRNSISSDATHTQIKHMPPRFPQLWVKPKSSISSSISTNSAAKLTSAKPAQCRKVLQSVGFDEPDDVSIKEAIAANDAFIKELERIRNAAQGLTLDQG
jgi:hypothetical protein